MATEQEKIERFKRVAENRTNINVNIILYKNDHL